MFNWEATGTSGSQRGSYTEAVAPGCQRHGRGFTTGLAASLTAHAAQPARPNVLWTTCEDTGPQLRCCGDEYSVTPNLDRLAARGTIYRNAWSNAPVCAPARTTIISGLYPPSTGAEHMRSMVNLPAAMKLFPQYLREAGYYCTNNAKEDYNLAQPGKVWDLSSKQGHWRQRAAGQPFFSVFNLEITHESQIRTRPHQWIHDPAKARVPAYHPDTLEVRQDWAQSYDNITTMDTQAGAILGELAKDGLADDTIVFFYGDHGSGMPRSKRWPYNSGLNVSILAHIPDRFRHLAAPEYRPGTSSDRLVGFVDLAPTMLSLAGLKAPDYYQGTAFLGSERKPERPFNYGFRGRMDERYDMVRSVRDKRYIYIRNYMPHKIYGQNIDYMFETPTTRVWKKLYDEGKLNAAQSRFWQTKPAEELFDLEKDRDEVNNLAQAAAHREILARLRDAQRQLAVEVRDVGFLPEAEIHSRGAASSPYQAGHDAAKYPLERIMAAAELAAGLQPEAMPKLIQGLGDGDSAVRHWSAMGILMRSAEAVRQAESALKKAMADQSPYVRITAAEALGRHGKEGGRSCGRARAAAGAGAGGPQRRLRVFVRPECIGLLGGEGQSGIACHPSDASGG
ncbi:MAG: sulfatase-like hydrolase/transferase [Candidatus Solibacter sp.]|nr:sulfatase-like hydrolase/transferase [Candidatus Solibacter sp.]